MYTVTGLSALSFKHSRKMHLVFTDDLMVAELKVYLYTLQQFLKNSWGFVILSSISEMCTTRVLHILMIGLFSVIRYGRCQSGLENPLLQTYANH